MPSKVRCSNRVCKFCGIDPVDQRLICTGLPDLMMWSNDVHHHMVRCKQFVERVDGSPLKVFRDETWNKWEDEDGLYPGQLKPPVDYSDIDLDETVGEVCELPGPESGKDCKT